MPEFYLIIVILLFALAISDLIVGVSNDAVNFLNSAIGSRVASRRTIMIVASLGILVGATFSSGMMEVARKGIFNPSYFYFADIMFIFLAVMITDILLLDLFNTFGMPTSTTVSIVFELLGAAVAVAILKIMQQGDSMSQLSEYINTSSAILIISGIFLSVLIAFVVGSIIQYCSRLLFTFHVKRRMDWLGSLWSGLALAALTYFLLIKGLKGASFVSDTFVSWVQSNTLLLLALSFVCWSIIMQLLIAVFQVNILRIVVLFGTFALAMAFAGNDLVNFIGVPIAGFESYLSWSNSGEAAGSYEMSALNQAVRTKTYLLVIAGLIMITTLWFSKKARSVTETEVNLGRQDEGTERFQPNALSRGIVRYAIALGDTVGKAMPGRLSERLAQRFEPYQKPIEDKKEYSPPAFDLVRASVNLTVASMLIAFATSLKLPLSTTYVSFMVAMGTSLADRAWGRSSAVFRIAGVINVIGGWFFTAIMAFTAAATFATLIYYFGGWAIALLVLGAIYAISRSFRFHKKKEQSKAGMKKFERQRSRIPAEHIINESAGKVEDTLQIIRGVYRDSISGLLKEDRRLLAKAEEAIRQLRAKNEELEFQLYSLIRRIDEQKAEGSRVYMLVYDLSQDILQSASLIVERSREYVGNSLAPINGEEAEPLSSIMQAVDQYLEHLIHLTKERQFEALPKILDHKQSIFQQLEKTLTNQVGRIKADGLGRRKSVLLLSIYLETKDLIAVAARFAKLYQRAEQLNGHREAYLMGKQ